MVVAGEGGKQEPSKNGRHSACAEEAFGLDERLWGLKGVKQGRDVIRCDSFSNRALWRWCESGVGGRTWN